MFGIYPTNYMCGAYSALEKSCSHDIYNIEKKVLLFINIEQQRHGKNCVDVQSDLCLW